MKSEVDILAEAGLGRLIKPRMNNVTGQVNYYVRGRCAWPKIFEGEEINLHEWFEEGIIEEATRFCRWLQQRIGRRCEATCRKGHEEYSVYLNIEVDAKLTLSSTESQEILAPLNCIRLSRDPS
jgi:hypothetical protein